MKKLLKNKPRLIIIVVLVLFTVLVGLLVLNDNNAEPAQQNLQDAHFNGGHGHEHKKGASDPGDGTLALSPANGTFRAGQTFSVTVKLDTAGVKVNAVQADLTYPVNRLKFVSISDSGSAFTIKAESSGSNGKIRIARGNVTPVSGKLKLASVKFKVLNSPGKATVAVSDSSVALRSSSSTDALGTLTGATFTVK